LFCFVLLCFVSFLFCFFFLAGEMKKDKTFKRRSELELPNFLSFLSLFPLFQQISFLFLSLFFNFM